MKKTFFAIALCMFCNFMLAQDLIRLADGTSFMAHVVSIEDGIVTYQDGVSKATLPKNEIALIEFAENGVRYFNREALHPIDPKDVPLPVYKRGNKVYIPFSSKDVAKRSGALKLREEVKKNGNWEVVDCVEEAHFILEFNYSEEGIDHGKVIMRDKEGHMIGETSKVRNSGEDLTTKGEVIAASLYNKYVSHLDEAGWGIRKGHLRKVSDRRKGLVIRPELEVGIVEGMDFVIGGSATVAYQTSPFFCVGGGVGLSVFTDFKDYTPVGSVYGDMRVYFCDKKSSPYFGLRLGYNFCDHDNGLGVVSGVMADASLGLIIKDFDFGISFGVTDVKHYIGPHLSLHFAYNIQLGK